MGPDGITRKDLISMPVAAQQAIVDSLNDIEGGSQWPVTCLLGLITSLEKHDRAKTVCDYRPICIFSLLYRCWARRNASMVVHDSTSKFDGVMPGPRCFHAMVSNCKSH